MAFPAGGLCCTGNIVLDILVRPVEALPEWGATRWVDNIEQHLGGNGAITAFTLGKLGAPVQLAGAVGDDAFGRYLLERLGSAGVDLEQVCVAPGSQTATTVGLINSRSDRLFLHVRGSSDLVVPEQVHFGPGLSYFHFASLFQLPRMRQGARRLLERARQAGLFTSLDTMWDPTGRWLEDLGPLCPLLDCLFVNQQEARMLAGSDQPAPVGRFFRDRGVGLVVLKMAEKGCAVSSASGDFTVPAFDVPAIDSTGAGDTFCGGFLAALRGGFPLHEATRFATAVAAHCVQQIGGADGVAGFEETRRWLAERGPGV